MHPAKRTLFLVNVIGGIAVLGSYAYGFGTAADPSALWGGVPEWLKPLYTASMLTAAAGYFLPLRFVMACDADRVRVGRGGFETFPRLYALMLVPSALWMPLTFQMVETPSGGLWIVIRVVLFAVAIGAVGLLAAIVRARPRPQGIGFWLAIVGQLAFCLQTAVLDPLVWPAYFPH
jgi:hypothetical protein